MAPKRSLRYLLVSLLALALSLTAWGETSWVCRMGEQVPKAAQGPGGDGALNPAVWVCTPGMTANLSTFNYARNPSPPVGNYEFVLRLRLADIIAAKPVLRVTLSEDPGVQLGDYTLYASDFATAGAYTEFRIPLVKSAEMSIIAWQLHYLGNVALDVDQVAVQSVHRYAQAPTVEITALSTSKLIYHANESPTALVSVRNNTKSPQTVTLLVTGEGGVDTEVMRATKPLQLDPGGIENAEIAWPVRGKQYGFAVRAQVLQDDKVLDEQSQIFAVADNFNQVSQYALLYPDLDAEHFRNVLEGMRAASIGAFEVDFWAPCDFSSLAPSADKWISGQGLRPIDKAGLQGAIDAAHAAGIRALTYGDMWLCGSDGFEWARKHPEQTLWGRNWYGGNYDVDQLDALRTNAQAVVAKTGGWCALTPSLADPEVQRFAAEELVRSTALFGWDGVRYDNYGLSVSPGVNLLGQGVLAKLPKSADDPNAALIRRLRAALTARNPHFVYGDNCLSRDDANPPDAKWKAEAEKGGMIMDEAVGQQSGGSTWNAIARQAVTATRTAREYGGYQVNIITNTLPKLCWAARPYLYVLTMAAGAHVAYASPAHGMSRYCAFAMRYGELLYDLSAHPLVGASIPFAVTAPVWWENYVTLRQLSGGRRQYLVSLINPPGGEQLTDVIALPQPQRDIPVTFTVPEGLHVTGAWALTPDPQPHAKKLAVTADPVITLHVPQLDYWTLLVVEAAPERKAE